MSVGNYDRSH